MHHKMEEGKIAFWFLLVGGIIWVVAEYWEIFEPIFLFLLLIFVLWFFWIGFSGGGNRDNNADDSDY